jgi:AraC-like DNA-binding protein
MPLFAGKLPLHAANGGYFKSRGQGCHPVRIIDSYELIFIESGILKIYENDFNFALPQGDCLILYPGRKHGGLSNYQPDLKFYWLHFMVDNKYRNIFENEIPQQVSLLYPDKMTGWFRRFLNDRETGTGTDVQCDLLLGLMITELAKPRIGGGSSSNALAIKTHDYMKVHFTDDIMVSDMAAWLGCNTDYLGRIFKQTYGLTINQCLNKMRISHSRKMLLESPMNIDEVAIASGYNDTTYFRRRFKAETGTSPCKFQKLYGKVHINTE